MSSAEADKLLSEIIEDFESTILDTFHTDTATMSRDANYLNYTFSTDITLSVTRLLANFPFPKVNKRHYLLQVFQLDEAECGDGLICEVLCEDEIDLDVVEEQVAWYQNSGLYQQWCDLRNLIEKEPDEVKPNT